MCIQQMQNYKIQPSPVYVLLCVQPGKYNIYTNTKILLCVQPGAYRRSDCPAADSTQSGEEPRQKSLLCSKMDKVELENRVELESKLQISRVELENRLELENRVELEKQLSDLQSCSRVRNTICDPVDDEKRNSRGAEFLLSRVEICAPVEE